VGVVLVRLAVGCEGILGVDTITPAPDAGSATLAVAYYGSDGGSGIVTVTPPGADEGGTIQVEGTPGGLGGNLVFEYPSGTRVTVTAMPDKGSRFEGWSLMYETTPGTCESQSPTTCTVTVVADTYPTVNGVFDGL
jgi:hypothetical protein